MPLEDLTGTNTYISNLVPTNPTATDLVSQSGGQPGDHINGIKNVILNTFPNITAPMDATAQQLNNLVANYPVPPTPLPIYSGESAVTTLTGVLVDIAVPAGVKSFKVLLLNGSLSGTESPLIQLGTSSGMQLTGYKSSAAIVSTTSTANATSYTTGFGSAGATATNTYDTIVSLEKFGTTNTWMAGLSGILNTNALSGGGKVTLTGEITTVRLTNTSSNTWDSGEVVVKWYF